MPKSLHEEAAAVFPPADEALFNDKREVRASDVIKLGEVGDWFKGTLTSNDRFIANKLSQKPGAMQQVLEFKMYGGSYHNIVDKVVDKEPTLIKEGEFRRFFANDSVQLQMKNIKLGQIVGVRFAERRKNPDPLKNAMHIIKVYAGDMDDSYQGETAAEVEA